MHKENKESVLNGSEQGEQGKHVKWVGQDHIFEHGQYIKVIPKVKRLGGENGQFWPNRSSNVGWSELAATNAPVADEPVEAVFRMNKNPILPTRIYLFPPLLYPKISPFLPTTYQPLPPPHSIARAPKTSSGSELGAASLEQGSGWSRSKTHAGPR